MVTENLPTSLHARLRVHFVPVGDQVERMVVPAQRLRADVVLFVTQSRKDDYRSDLERALTLIRKGKAQADVIECDIWDAPTVVNEVGAVVTSAPNHDYFFNVSTGAKPACLGGSMASMFVPVRPYYQPVEYEGSVGQGKRPSRLLDDIQFFPTFKAPPFGKTDAETLQFIVESKVPLRKKELMDQLKQLKLIAPKERAEVTKQAFHAQTDVILARLESWGFIHVRERGRRMRIEATDLGQGGARMFDYILHPRTPLEVLRT